MGQDPKECVWQVGCFEGGIQGSIENYKVGDAINKKRRGRDLNPGTGFPVSGFQDRCNQPLCHPSYSKSIFKVLPSFAKSVSIIFIIPRSIKEVLSHKTMNTGPTFP